MRPQVKLRRPGLPRGSLGPSPAALRRAAAACPFFCRESPLAAPAICAAHRRSARPARRRRRSDHDGRPAAAAVRVGTRRGALLGRHRGRGPVTVTVTRSRAPKARPCRRGRVPGPAPASVPGPAARGPGRELERRGGSVAAGPSAAVAGALPSRRHPGGPACPPVSLSLILAPRQLQRRGRRHSPSPAPSRWESFRFRRHHDGPSRPVPRWGSPSPHGPGPSATDSDNDSDSDSTVTPGQ